MRMLFKEQQGASSSLQRDGDLLSDRMRMKSRSCGFQAANWVSVLVSREPKFSTNCERREFAIFGRCDARKLGDETSRREVQARHDVLQHCSSARLSVLGGHWSHMSIYRRGGTKFVDYQRNPTIDIPSRLPTHWIATFSRDGTTETPYRRGPGTSTIGTKDCRQCSG
jgi:hypothetical protein